MTMSEARRLRELEAENSKLERLLADAEFVPNASPAKSGKGEVS
jgi:hypothetical protein